MSCRRAAGERAVRDRPDRVTWRVSEDFRCSPILIEFHLFSQRISSPEELLSFPGTAPVRRQSARLHPGRDARSENPLAPSISAPRATALIRSARSRCLQWCRFTSRKGRPMCGSVEDGREPETGALLPQPDVANSSAMCRNAPVISPAGHPLTVSAARSPEGAFGASPGCAAEGGWGTWRGRWSSSARMPGLRAARSRGWPPGRRLRRPGRAGSRRAGSPGSGSRPRRRRSGGSGS